MSDNDTPRNAQMIARVTADAERFFEAHPERTLYAGYLGNTEQGEWAYLVMGKDGPYGGFELLPTSDELTCEQFTTLMNTLPRGEQVMKDSVDKVGGTVRAGLDKVLRRALAAAPTSSTRH
ncbi:hypothetical protein B0G81_4345 [Paraburkholderia sp. BL6665CI2N2]|nr:hypothetical protein B0G81_4345 [Paraburkholderia sp. BL6665CI2N2]